MTATTDTRDALDRIVCDELGGTADTKRRNAKRVTYKIPASRGHLWVHVTLRPRWCSVDVDRWHTTDRNANLSRPWFEATVWPRLLAYRRSGTMPTGAAAWTSASPITADDLLDVIGPWLQHELTDWATETVGTR